MRTRMGMGDGDSDSTARLLTPLLPPLGLTGLDWAGQYSPQRNSGASRNLGSCLPWWHSPLTTTPYYPTSCTTTATQNVHTTVF
ncbi:hypothetical protein V496_08927 [Pseudogymnoascus sp. VKM F-4515 (FW-2607)]|nr:hypothetical protein V496_08927 [Pseudogymnoascus sp. VKM F-4515 (FW-2607)]